MFFHLPFLLYLYAVSNPYPIPALLLTNGAFIAGQYTFQRFKAWQVSDVQPPPPEALKLLHRLASDPGIAGIMNKHRSALSD